MDEFYLPNELVEWLGLKKAEYLSKLIEHVSTNDFQFHEYATYDRLIPQTLQYPDWTAELKEDGQKVRIYVRNYFPQEGLEQVVIGAVIADQKNEDVFVPIIAFVTRDGNLVRLFHPGYGGPILN
jgi:hypothetical protein